MLRQDYRINKIFLPFQKKGKKHHPSSREAMKKIKSIQLILSENILTLCLNGYELISINWSFPN